MKYATNNIYSIILLACASMMIPVLSVALLGWASIQFSLWEPINPIADLGQICLLLLVLIVVPAAASVFLGFLLDPAKSDNPVERPKN
jgi:uncharacterized paraquat-inducible protein A